jgi:hypothetical protein
LSRSEHVFLFQVRSILVEGDRLYCELGRGRAGFDVEWSLAEGGGTLLLPTEDLVPGFFNSFF